MYQVDAAGYRSQAVNQFAPPNLTGKILQAYAETALTAQLARSQFLTEEELTVGGKAIFSRESEIVMFSMETDNNEHPENLPGPEMEQVALQVCQSEKFEIKMSDEDRVKIGSNIGMWEDATRRTIDIGIKRLIDAYSIPKIIASADPDNVGIRAGKITHSYNLGDQGGNALTINSVDTFEKALWDLIEVGTEAGMITNEHDDIIDGAAAPAPIIIIPTALQRYAVKLLDNLNICCSDEHVKRTGRIGRIFGVDIIPTKLFVPRVFGASGPLNHMMLVDPNRILHVLKIITNKWWEDKYESYLVGQFLYDTHVLDPYAVAVNTYKAA